MSAATELPFYLQGNFAPVDEEVTASDLPVEGSIPPELSGVLLRNGPNPTGGRDPGHWFLGEGMLHGVRLEGGAARWYRNRWVRTRCLAEPDAQYLREDGTLDFTLALGNTHVVSHAGRTLALVENAFPTEVTRELETVGLCDFDGKLTTPMTAHPKRCPRTGELHFFGYSALPPHLTYHRLDPAGKLVRSEEIAVPGPTMMHDFAITDRNVIFMDLPIVFDVSKVEVGTPFAWSDDYGARLGVMPRDGSAADIRWLEIEPCYVFHPFNAYDDGSTVVLDVCRYPELWRAGADAFQPARPHRFVLDVEADKVTEQPLDDRTAEFPRVDDRLCGRRHRYAYAVSNHDGVSEESQDLLKYDLASGGVETHSFGSGRSPSEGCFVPASGAAGEDEGFVLAYVYDAARNGSDVVLLDAANFAAPPLATIRLPQRVPFGFHGNWIPDPA